MVSIMGDIRELDSLTRTFEEHTPEFVFHMAAQSLVRRSYREPLETYSTNIVGTANVLEAARHSSSVRVLIVITSDKCYENREWDYAYRENDPMGGYDPYSASKGAAEVVTASYRSSFFPPDRVSDHGVSLASVRAGNIIGGGDWAEDRLVPDCIRALTSDIAIPVRNPRSIRPWQHVLEPLSGYLWLGARMWDDPSRYAQAWNFGPYAASHVTTGEIVNQILTEWGSGEWKDVSMRYDNEPHEAAFLKLDCTKVSSLLQWRPVLSIHDSVKETVAWYRQHHLDPDFDGCAVTGNQIETYVNRARESGALWARTN
jgi:CDP-glucose 4,6-dehydratase